jgi:hypothetical protein
MNDKVEKAKTCVLLGRDQLMAADFASTEDNKEHPFVNVHIMPDGTTEASNWHFAIRVPPAGIVAEGFPVVVGLGAPFNGAGLLIPAETCKAALKALPKKAKSSVLGMAHLGVAEDGGAVLTTTDLKTTIARVCKVADRPFPDLNSVMPSADADGRIIIRMNAHYLKAIAEYAIKVANNSKEAIILRLSINPEKAENTAMLWQVSLKNKRTAEIALMPRRG